MRFKYNSKLNTKPENMLPLNTKIYITLVIVMCMSRQIHSNLVYLHVYLYSSE